MKTNGKEIKLKKGKMRLDGLLISCPGHDLAVSVRFPRMLRQSEVAQEELRIKSIVKGWYESSGEFSDEHYICICNGPIGCQDTSKVHSMVFCVDVSVYSIEEVQMGKGEDSFVQMYSDEFERLMLMLD